MIVVVKPCRRCGCKHRGMLLPRSSERTIWVGDDREDLPAGTPRMLFLPKPTCESRAARVVSALIVQEGRVFKVLDGLEAPSTETAGAETRQRVKETTDVR